jgi:NAD(P)-dependent dehydrogenase (short-subunit alcohol dehydrogenase family)
MDVDDDDAVTHGVHGILSTYGKLHAVVACAGWGLAGPAETTPIEDAKAQLESNFWGAVRVVNAVLPAMRRQGGGRLVVMSSICGLLGLPFQSYYSASKFALEGFAEAITYEVAPFNVHVTLVEPGNFKTGFTASRRTPNAQEGDPYALASTKAITTMEHDEQHGASPDVVAALVERVLDSRMPPRRVSVGKRLERFGLVIKRFLPFRLFEASVKSSLGV